MRLPRFRLISLIGVVVWMAIILGGLRESTYFCAELFESATLTILAVAALRTIVLRDVRQIYWAGFLTAGTIYLVATWNPSSAERVITDHGLDIFGQITEWSKDSSVAPAGNLVTSTLSERRFIKHTIEVSIRLPVGRNRMFMRSAHFYQIGHSSLALACGMLGGWYARRLRLANGGQVRSSVKTEVV